MNRSFSGVSPTGMVAISVGSGFPFGFWNTDAHFDPGTIKPSMISLDLGMGRIVSNQAE
jgi:hypothetical protein